MSTEEQTLTEKTNYTALLALPDGGMAMDAAARIAGAEVTDNEKAGVWVSWTTTAETDEEAIQALQEIRLRAEMSPDFMNGETTPSGADPTLFQATPFIVLRGTTTIIHSEEVLCI